MSAPEQLHHQKVSPLHGWRAGGRHPTAAQRECPLQLTATALSSAQPTPDPEHHIPGAYIVKTELHTDGRAVLL